MLYLFSCVKSVVDNYTKCSVWYFDILCTIVVVVLVLHGLFYQLLICENFYFDMMLHRGFIYQSDTAFILSVDNYQFFVLFCIIKTFSMV